MVVVEGWRFASSLQLVCRRGKDTAERYGLRLMLEVAFDDNHRQGALPTRSRSSSTRFRSSSSSKSDSGLLAEATTARRLRPTAKRSRISGRLSRSSPSFPPALDGPLQQFVQRLVGVKDFVQPFLLFLRQGLSQVLHVGRPHNMRGRLISPPFGET